MLTKKVRNFSRKLIIWLLVVTFLSTSFITADHKVFAYEEGNYPLWSGIPPLIGPEELLSRMPQLGGDPFHIPDPAKGILPGIPAGTGMTDREAPPQAPGAVLLPEPPPQEDVMKHPVALATGALRLENTDLALPGNGFGFKLVRSYSSAIADAGPFGRGWNFNLGAYLRIYSEFDMAEFRADGSIITYSFVKDDPNGYVNSFDGDNLINYDLDKGHYETASTGDALARIGPEEYIVTHPDGSKTTYKGYIAPWRNGQPEWAGQITKQEDRYGNARAFAYNESGKIISITDTAGRVVNFHWNGDVIASVTAPAGFAMQYGYDSDNR